MDEETSLVLTGVYSGIRMEMAGTSGLVITSAAVTALTGYGIATKKTSDDKPFTVLSVASTQDAPDPANLVVASQYTQTVSLAEVDLEVRYTDIPADSQLQVEATESTFAISRQPISGTSLIGSSGKDLEAFSMDLTLNLWVAHPDTLKSKSALTLSLSKIEGGNGGPVKKVLLQKIQINLSH